MLPPSLSNKLPSQGGPINNGVQDGAAGLDGSGGISEGGGGNDSTSAVASVPDTTGMASTSGADNDVIMSDAQDPKPHVPDPHNHSSENPDGSVDVNVLDQAKPGQTSENLPPQAPLQVQEQEIPSTTVQMMDTSDDGLSGQNAVVTESNSSAIDSSTLVNGKDDHSPSQEAPVSTVPTSETTASPNTMPPVVPQNDTKIEANSTSATTTDTVMEIASEETTSQVTSQAPAMISEKVEETNTSVPPSNASASSVASNAAAQFLGGNSSASLATGISIDENKSAALDQPAQPPQESDNQLETGAAPGDVSSTTAVALEKPANHGATVTQPEVVTTEAEQGQENTTKPVEENSNATEVVATGVTSETVTKLVQDTTQPESQPQPNPTTSNQQPNVTMVQVDNGTSSSPATTTAAGTMSEDTPAVETNDSKPVLSNAAGAAVIGSSDMNGGQPTPPVQSQPVQPQPVQPQPVQPQPVQPQPVQPQPVQPQPPRPAPGGPMMGGMRELRVEDALLYLDDVKREFGGRPRVYNEFLAIMKNFKSQEVDTPGVIARVSKLFRGNNHLILGFNKFLPDGYKISMEDLKQMDAVYAREEELLRQQQEAMLQKGQPQLPLAHQSLAVEQQRQLQQNQRPQSPHPAPAPPSQPLSMMQQQQIRDVQMRDAQAEQVAQATGQRMVLATDLEEQQRHQQALPNLPKGKVGKGSKKQQQAQQPLPPQQQPQQHPPQMQHQAVEFDHAISYVTTIKRRFANDQSTYHSFLEILHTYQKEQRGIKEVLEQVAHLFQDHPDLLKEFTFFLPDAVQEQAKERLHRAAAESENRLSAQKNGTNISLQGSSKEVIDMTDHTRGMITDQGDARGQQRYNDTQQTQILITYPQAPETFVYNSAVERQFFDAAREALASYTRDGGQAWAEFMKCLDMYAQEILSKSEMLNLIEPLLGKRNNKLFEEFKRILSAAGGQGLSAVPSIEDSWYSVPLTEIDFSRCRKCGPSYRALPRDYPAPPVSQRSDEEAKVLNDVWVSLPVGSEESYTFRHMRRNTHEETLFRVEDERFEIDMTIDSNMCTLALLEPFAEEMAQLSGDSQNVYKEKENEAIPNGERMGLGGKRFRYTFDPSILGVIHRNSITRIYGESGPKMLELLKNNPSVAIPTVVRRLRQKDIEFRAARDNLNRHCWREMARSNYYKSLDHRGLTFRTTDKRAISNRTFLNDIKDRAANNGNESAAALQARIDKAKEEHGTFFEITMAGSDEFLRNLDRARLPKPDRRLFTPHLSFMYENSSCIQKDAYRILSFALERGSISPTDKERCHRLWTEFLGPWFNLKLNWMLEPAVTFQETKTTMDRLPRVVSQDDNSNDEDDETPDEDNEIKAKIVTEEIRDDANEVIDTPLNVDHHPLPAGTTVSTIYGEGVITGCRKEDNIYVVRLAFGNAYLRPSAVLCSILDAEKSAYTTHRMVDDHTKLDRPSDQLIIGTQSLYLFFRLHQILCRRIGIARRLAFTVGNDPSLQTVVEPLRGQVGVAAGKRRYEAFLSLVYALLDGGTGSASEGGKFEDRVRTLLGHWSYELATFDKVISHILKNIQNMANDDTMWSLIQLYRRHVDAGGFKPEALRQEAAYLSEGEPMYAFQYCPIQKERGEKAILHMENLGVIVGSEEEDSLSDQVVEPSSKRQRR